MSFRRFVRRPHYADFAATLALVLALSGTAYAVTTVVDPNSVDTAAIQDHAVTSPKLASEAVTSDKISPRSVSVADLAGNDATTALSFSLPSHSCGYLSISVPGATVGQVSDRGRCPRLDGGRKLAEFEQIPQLVPRCRRRNDNSASTASSC